MYNKSVVLSIFLVFVIFIQLNSSETTESPAEKVDIIKNEKIEKTEKQKPQTGGLAPAAVSDEDLDKLLQDKRYLSRQIKCALGQGVCDPVGRRLKSLAPLVLRGACPKCTETEKKQIQKTLSYIQRNYPKDWARLMATYTG